MTEIEACSSEIKTLRKNKKVLFIALFAIIGDFYYLIFEFIPRYFSIKSLTKNFSYFFQKSYNCGRYISSKLASDKGTELTPNQIHHLTSSLGYVLSILLDSQLPRRWFLCSSFRLR